jgi:hypothetical protein
MHSAGKWTFLETHFLSKAFWIPANIELSPFGVHWPNLDEALSIHGILA